MNRHQLGKTRILKKNKFLFLLVFLLISSNSISQVFDLRFEILTVEDGLPENSVTCTLQDYLGFLWFGTQNGLAKYNGHSMTIYRPDTTKIKSITDTEVTAIYEDKNKALWIGMLNALNKFDRATETFTEFKSVIDDPKTISSEHIRYFYEDSKGRVWVGTSEGLNLLDLKSETFTRYYFWKGESVAKDKPNYVKVGNQLYQDNLSISAIIEDPASGELLFGTEIEGLWKFNPETKSFLQYKFNTVLKSDDRIRYVQSFCKDKSGKIWIATNNLLTRFNPYDKTLKTFVEIPVVENRQYSKWAQANAHVIEGTDGNFYCGFFNGEKGIFVINPNTGFIQQQLLFTDKPKGAYFNEIFSVYEDKTGIIWIGTWGSGLAKYDKRKNNFQMLRSDPHNFSNCLSHPEVYSRIFDQNNIWFSTRRSLDKYDIKKGTFKHYLTNEKAIVDYPYSSIIDNAGKIWLATSYDGMIRFDPDNETYKFFFNNRSDPINLSFIGGFPMIQDKLGDIWVGTTADGFGLYKFDLQNYKLNRYINNPSDFFSLSENETDVIYEDKAGTIWIGTKIGGLNKYDRKNDNFIRCGFSGICGLYEDKLGNFWVSDYATGLNLYDRKSNKILANHNMKDGLPSNYIHGFLEDDHYNLWLCTDNGLSKFNVKNRTFKNYRKEDGLPANNFTIAYCSKAPDGRMFFNTPKGDVVFHPDSITDDPTPPQLVLTGMSLFNRPNEKLEYQGFISDLKEVTLSYNQNDLRFDFVGLHYSEPSKNQYKYFLENFDDDWVNAGTQKNAIYTNLDPGKYIFRFTASNKDGIWNKTGASIIIIITPPWWKTWWAYLFYVLIAGSILNLIWRMQLKRIKVKNEYEMAKFEAQKLHEVDEVKSRFFTNISHEFRTPLTLILGPVKQLIEKVNDEKIKDDLSLVHRNAKKLLGLVNQLLDISKIESGSMKLRTTQRNIIPLLKALVLSFTSYAERKKINLQFKSAVEEITAYIDTEKIEKIINNLLSNAFKFTPDGGKIEVTIASPKSPPKEGTFKEAALNCEDGVEASDQFVEIKISDSGIGIPKNEITKIFNRFYQVDGSHTREQEGTGIGLSLTKELVELHKGKLEVESEEGRGTKFTFSIPLGKHHLKPEEICLEESKKAEEKYSDNDVSSYDFETRIKNINTKFDFETLDDDGMPILLLVEDNTDVRNYIKENLKNDYRILEACDGEDGWDKSIENMPDLIVSDVMMPKMDGFALCAKIKADEKTSHIPIILLTAKAASTDKVEGFELGADDYIMKPFEPKELNVRIKNLIQQRKRIHEHFQRDGILKLHQAKITSVDKKFLQKVFEIVNLNISNSSFTVEEFADNLAMSRSLLHKKLVSLAGEAPSDLLRRLRLNKAAELIVGNFGNLSEIAFEVGFENPAYFSECFKKQYGVSPSQYKQK